MKQIIEDMKRQIDKLNNDVNKLAEEMKKSEEKDTPEWALRQDRINFNTFAVDSNYGKWIVSKSQLKNGNAFYLRTDKVGSTKEYGYSSFSLEEAKQLRDYLDQKIQYLES